MISVHNDSSEELSSSHGFGSPDTAQHLLDTALAQGVAKRRIKQLSSMITAISNISVQYNFQAISIALIVMSQQVCTLTPEDCKSGDQASWVASTATATVFAGCIAGQLTMGYAGDVFGRDAALTFTLGLASIAALLSALAPTGDASSIYLAVILCRFALGLGLGGVYPLSATKAAEDSSDGHGKTNSLAASKAFFWQGPGSMIPWIFALLLVTYGNGSTEDINWRLILGMGFIPSFCVVLGSVVERRMKAKAKAASEYEAEEKSNSRQFPAIGEPQPRTLWQHLGDRGNQIDLIATGGGWFLYDVCYYGVNLFGGQIVSQIYPSEDDNISSNNSIRNITEHELIALSMGIPASLLTIFLLSYFSTKQLQVYGFLLIAVCFFALAGLFNVLQPYPSALYTIYCLLLFSLSFGPNVTTFILPSETYPTEVRSTFNGISAAAGKLGAVVGAYMFGALAKVTSYVIVMIICGVLAVLGSALSWWFIRTTRCNTTNIGSSSQQKRLLGDYDYEEEDHN